ncbi:MAG: sensor histidine kinase, partial [Bdellovibrionota bacterium]
LFDSSLCAILPQDDPSRSVVLFGPKIHQENLSAMEPAQEFLKKHVRSLSERGAEPAKIHAATISREAAPWFASAGITDLAAVLISGEVQGGASIRSPKSRRDFGWLVIGLSRPLRLDEEVGLLAAAQRLAELARVAALEASIELRSQFLSIASHELKTPLTSIYGILQLQERMLRMKKDSQNFPDQERHHAFLKMVIRQTERLNELIDGLLDVSRIQNGRFVIEPTETDVAALAREVTQNRLRVIAEEAGVRLELDAPESLRAVVDPVRMEEVMMNLVMNAIRFSPEGGVVWIRLRPDNGAFRLTVRDQGPSVPAEDLERIFQPFERAARTARLGGLGLGLFISRQIAQLHGGNVSLVESVAGKGNVFEAYFPTGLAPSASIPVSA